MGRAPCCDKASVKKGPWSPEEDAKLKEFIDKFGTGGNWIALPHKAGLKRCGKSCRLRWLNYLRPNIKHGEFSDDEDRIICTMFASIGSRWSIIAAQLPGRTDNDIKNYWNTKLKKKLLAMAAIHPSSSSSSSLSSLISAATHKKPLTYSYQSTPAPPPTAATHLSAAANYNYSSLIHDHQDNNHNYFNFNNYSNYNSSININTPPPMPISMSMNNNNTLLHGAYNNWCNFNSPSPLLGFQYSQEYSSSSLQYNTPMQQHDCAGGMIKFGVQHEAAAATTSSNNSEGSCISYGKHEKMYCKQEDDNIALPAGAGVAVLGFGDQGYNQSNFNMMDEGGSGEKPKGYNGNTAMTATTTPLWLQDDLEEIKQMVISSSFMFNDEINKTVDDKGLYFSYYN